MKHHFHHVAVLMGGGSTEREISLVSGRAALAAGADSSFPAEGWAERPLIVKTVARSGYISP